MRIRIIYLFFAIVAMIGFSLLLFFLSVGTSKNFTVEDMYSISNSKSFINYKLKEDVKDLTTSSVGIGGTVGEINNEDDKKVAAFFDSRAKGPCVNLGTYIVAKMKEKNVPIYYAIVFPGQESGFGANCVGNNFGGIGGASNMWDFKTPQECADKIAQLVVDYKNNYGADPKKLAEITAIYLSGMTYDKGGKSSGDWYAKEAWKLVEECEKSSGVPPDFEIGIH